MTAERQRPGGVGTPPLLTAMAPHPRAGEVTMHDCLMTVVMGMGGLAVAFLGAGRWGWAGALLGLPVGFLATLGLFYAIAMIGVLIERDWVPPCHEGHSGGSLREPLGSYEFVWRDEDGGTSQRWQEGGELLYRCPDCGREYVKAGRRFTRCLPDGTLEPYMVWKLFRGYVPDDDAGGEVQ